MNKNTLKRANELMAEKDHLTSRRDNVRGVFRLFESNKITACKIFAGTEETTHTSDLWIYEENFDVIKEALNSILVSVNKDIEAIDKEFSDL